MTDDNPSGQVVVVFSRPKLNNGHYSSEEFEDIFYKDVVLDGKPTTSIGESHRK